MNDMSLAERRVIGAQAWRVTFGDAETAKPAVKVVAEPQRPGVTTRAIDVDAALAGPDEAEGTSLVIIWLPTGEDVPAGMEKQLKQWIDAGSSDDPPVRANIRTNRVVWTDRRATIFTTPDQWPDTLDAVIRFTMMARETAALERDMKGLWPAVRKDTPLSHAVSYRQERRQGHVNKMTEMVTRMRISYLRLVAEIEQTDQSLTSATKRLYAELVLQGTIYDRLDVMEEPIQFAMDHYELSNTRLIEHKTARIEIVLTALITIALLLQTAFIVLQELPK